MTALLQNKYKHLFAMYCHKGIGSTQQIWPLSHSVSAVSPSAPCGSNQLKQTRQRAEYRESITFCSPGLGENNVSCHQFSIPYSEKLSGTPLIMGQPGCCMDVPEHLPLLTFQDHRNLVLVQRRLSKILPLVHAATHLHILCAFDVTLLCF